MSDKSLRVIATLLTPASLLLFGGGLFASFQTTLAILHSDLPGAKSASLISLLLFILGALISLVGALIVKRWARSSDEPRVYWVTYGALLTSAAFQVIYMLLSLLSSVF